MSICGFGNCLICEKEIIYGPVVIAEVIGDDVKSFAHAQCWVDSGKTVIGPEEIRLMLGAAALPVFAENLPGNYVRDAVQENW